jgi:hypothetical protein
VRTLADGAVAARSSERITRQIPFPGSFQYLHEPMPVRKIPHRLCARLVEVRCNVAFGSEAEILKASTASPLYPRKRTFYAATCMSALGQQRTSRGTYSVVGKRYNLI